MKISRILIISSLYLLFTGFSTWADPVIYFNQVAFDTNSPKIAVVGADLELDANTRFIILDCNTMTPVFQGKLQSAQQIPDWELGKICYQANFTKLRATGLYKLMLKVKDQLYTSGTFRIGDNLLARMSIPAIVHYYHRQRANSAEELAADSHVQLFGSTKTVDLRGGWCDASGDVSKYFSHLAYANFMSPQQIPLVTWSLTNTAESIKPMLESLGAQDSIDQEALYGADYLYRSLSTEDYFYMTVFSYFSKDPNARRVVGLHANSVTTNEYQSAYREGGGMAIAALARISRWKKNGSFTSAQYLDGARRAFTHLQVNNTRYDDDGRENIIDDYCALLAATELWIATDETVYQDEARKRAAKLTARLSPDGYFIADGGTRPFWHASDAGMPIIALCRYLKKETDKARRDAALETVKKALWYNLHVTYSVDNPFGYARQTFKFKNEVMEGFFMPHENETGWWWQGENARLASLATAALVGGRTEFQADKSNRVLRDSLQVFASRQLSWILGCNPYSVCFLYQFGHQNVPAMHSNFGHGSEKGGISNGITGKEGNPDGTGIDFKTSDNGNEWRWTEQWLPHSAWFLQAVTALAED